MDRKTLIIVASVLLVTGAGVGIYFLIRKKGVSSDAFGGLTTSTAPQESQKYTQPGGFQQSAPQTIGKYTLSDLGEGYHKFDVIFLNDMNEKIFEGCRFDYPGKRNRQLDCALQKIKLEQQGKSGYYADRINAYSFEQIKNAFFKPKWTDFIITWTSAGEPMNV